MGTVTDMRDTYGRYEVVALHLDYANRAESGREADFVEAWCRQMGIIFRKRVVGEVTRGVTARDEYEKVSREIRFAFYQEVSRFMCCRDNDDRPHVGSNLRG